METPPIGVLYESDEWSDWKLAAEISRALEAQTGRPASQSVRMIAMEDPGCVEAALECGLLVSRIFASAAFRNHRASLQAMERLIAEAAKAQIPLLNPGRAHSFEVSKRASTAELARNAITVPAVYAAGAPEAIDEAVLPYPCLIKPDCGGRTTFTAILHDAGEARAFLQNAPAMDFLVQKYIHPERGFITRMEIVDGTVPLIVKRSVAENGLSAYHLGSRYQIYDDCPAELVNRALQAAQALGFVFGSFDIIETDRGAFFIDANSVSNVSEDCTELFNFDLMAAYGQAIAKRYLTKMPWNDQGEE